jgi:glc operon protein GlcG
MKAHALILATLAVTCGSPIIAIPNVANAAGLTETTKVINQAGGQSVLRAAIETATRLNAPCAIAIVDRSGILVAFDRMDGVRGEGPDLAIGKARAAALLERPTLEIEDSTDQGRTAFVTAGLLTLRGGVPLRDDHQVVGAIGVAGLNKDNDVKIATEASEAFAKQVGHR